MSTLRGCAESNAEFPNIVLSQGSDIDIGGKVLSLIEGKVDSDTKFGIEMGLMVSFIVCL